MTPLSKQELLLQMNRFAKDANRGIALRFFAELAGVSLTHFKDVFLYQTQPLTETLQRRVNIAYRHWKEGRIKVMRKPDKTRYVDYRKQPQPPIMRNMGLKVTPEGIKLRVGMVNRHDYSESDLKESLRG